MVTDCGIGMGGQVVEKHITSLFGVGSRGGLVVGDFIERNDDGGVARSGVIKKETGDLLNAFDGKFVEERGNVMCGQLSLLTVHWGCPTVG